MSPPSGRALGPALAPIIALAFFSQIYISMTANSPGVFAPVVAPALGVSPQALGVFYWIFGIAAMAATLFAPGFIRRFGGGRLLQGVGLGMTLSLLIAASGSGWLIALCAIVMGVAVGPHVTAIMHLLARAAPVHRLGLLVSLVQAGGAIGVGLSGIIIPYLILGIGWQYTLIVLSAGGLLLSLAFQSYRHVLDNDRQPTHRISVQPHALLRPLLLALRERVLRAILIAAFVLSMVFQSLVGFIVSYLNLELRFSLVVAGLALTASQVASLVARVAFGWLADRLRDPFVVLAGIGIAATLSGLVLALIGPSWPVWAICLAAAAYGASASGWVSTCFGAMAAHSPRDQVASATSSAQIIML
ncbi:MAG: MFS transporter, partial [Betaproteobacteria bacterium]|nr:MFS transporter [Betaproteobacteria bacterium]